MNTLFECTYPYRNQVNGLFRLGALAMRGVKQMIVRIYGIFSYVRIKIHSNIGKPLAQMLLVEATKLLHHPLLIEYARCSILNRTLLGIKSRDEENPLFFIHLSIHILNVLLAWYLYLYRHLSNLNFNIIISYLGNPKTLIDYSFHNVFH